MYLLNKIIWFFADPFILAMMGFVICFIFARRRIWLLLCFSWLWFWSCGIGTYFLDKQMVAEFPPMRAETFPTADAIVDLGGGMGRRCGRTGYAEMNPAADRVWMSARLWKAGKAPIVIPTGIGCAETDGQLLEDLGVPKSAIVVDNVARNTEENARFVTRLLSDRGKLHTVDCGLKPRPRILLVTSVWHMRRSVLMFEKYAPEMEVIPVATDYEGRDDVRFTWRRILPSGEGLCGNVRAAHEIAGYLWYKYIR